VDRSKHTGPLLRLLDVGGAISQIAGLYLRRFKSAYLDFRREMSDLDAAIPLLRRSHRPGDVWSGPSHKAPNCYLRRDYLRY